MHSGQSTPGPLTPALAIDQVEVCELPLSAISIGEFCRRRSYDDLDSLVRSIEKNGLLQPVTVTADADGRYTLVCGSRRYKAHEQLGRRTIASRVISVTPAKAAVLSISENVDREDMHPVELARHIKFAMKTFGYTEQEIADNIGWSQSTVSALVGILRLGEDIIEKIGTASESPFKRTHAEILAELVRSTRVNRQVEAQQLFKKTVKHALGTKELKALVQLFKTGGFRRLPEAIKGPLLHEKGMTSQMAMLYLEPAKVVEGDGKEAERWRHNAERLDRKWLQQHIIKAAKAGWSFEKTKQGLLEVLQGQSAQSSEIKSGWQKLVADISTLRDRLDICRHEIPSRAKSHPVELQCQCYEIQNLQSQLNNFVGATQNALGESPVAQNIEERSESHDSTN